MFSDVLCEFAEQAGQPRVTAVARRLRVPVRVAVRGRRGVGRGTVAAALAASGVAVTSADSASDVAVVVIAETVKDEERAALRAPDVPTLVVLNKSDLTGAGPPALAEERAARVAAAVGLPVVPMMAHLARVDLDDGDIAALRALVATPADMTSVDAFSASEHPLPAEVRRNLMDRLDRFGLAHAVLAVGDGMAPQAVAARLRALSRTDDVLTQLSAAAAPVRYGRICAALRELRSLAVRARDDRLDAFLDGDDAVVAVMAAAVDVVEAAGMTVDRGDDAEAHTRRALVWRRYARGPVTALHQRCATDIARGSLRLLENSP